MSETPKEFEAVIEVCRNIFMQKMHDYGTAWRILRPTSITDQIFIKANRIRCIEEKGITKVNEGIVPEFIGIINYAIMGLIQLEMGANADDNQQVIAERYLHYFHEARKLMENKNHDYDEAWRSMRVSSYTDLILMKINRTRQIEDLKGDTLISEGIDANYYDMINYAVFALIRLVIEKENTLDK
ncbi:DUF1599 domain-containing protein [Odoribacter lunatus]|uniref:DUF1599 domain-containing protein n=1 Tax=Odoribacter lunatus TaxID=2941335 RepID=UPI00203ABFCE|nr:DUF1599 domain-containing protein [Odoribacter lunatus]